MFTLRDVLDMAVTIERNGESVYRDALSQTPDPELAEVLEWMAQEEAKHAEHFGRMRDEIARHEDNPILDELGKLMLADIVGDQRFSLEGVDFSKIEEVNGLLKVMIDFEHDTLTFYELFRSFLDDEGERARLDAIIADERAHILKLEECRGKNLACHRL
jgi:rubrerythrin